MRLAQTPAICGYRLGCEVVTCQRIRDFYSIYLGSGTPPPGRINYQSLQYAAGRGYTVNDFNTVIKQLRTEQAYLANVQLIYGQLAETWNSTETTVQLQLSNVAANLEQDLRDRAQQQQLGEKRITQAANLFSAGGSIPGIGIGLFSLVGCIARLLSADGTRQSHSPGILASTGYLDHDNKELGLVLSNTNVSLFLGIVNDWGKLQTIGQGYASGSAPWYMCANCAQSLPPRNSIPVIALGTKRGFYSALLPHLYSMDVFLNSAAPIAQRIGGELGGAFKWCEASYSDAGASYLGYPNVDVPSLNDFYIFTQTTRGSVIGGRIINKFASQNLLDNLFGAP